MGFYRETFTTPYEQYAEHEGQPFRLIRAITKPGPEFDAVSLPMYEVEFEGGTHIHAWPEEVVNGCREVKA